MHIEVCEIFDFKIHNYFDTSPPDGIPFGDLDKSINSDGKVRVYDHDIDIFNRPDPLVNNTRYFTQDPINSRHSKNNKYYRLYSNTRNLFL